MCVCVSPSVCTILTPTSTATGRFHQHSVDQFNMQETPLDYMCKVMGDQTEREKVRQFLGRYGITGKVQVMRMGTLSDGQLR